MSAKKDEANLAVKYRDIGDIKGYDRNARTHSDEHVAQIAASIEEFGFNNPVLIDETGTIIAGHGRVAAAQALSLEAVPCIVLAHLTDTQRRAYILADNRLALNAGWDDGLLAEELATLADEDFDCQLLGFNDGELAALLGEFATAGEMPKLPDSDKQPFQQMTFTVHDEQAETVSAALEKAKKAGPFTGSPNENSNGNALDRICSAYLRGSHA